MGEVQHERSLEWGIGFKWVRWRPEKGVLRVGVAKSMHVSRYQDKDLDQQSLWPPEDFLSLRGVMVQRNLPGVLSRPVCNDVWGVIPEPEHRAELNG